MSIILQCRLAQCLSGFKVILRFSAASRGRFGIDKEYDIPALLVSAMLLAGLYATMSFGLALIYGVMKIMDLAHAGAMFIWASALFLRR